MADRILALTAIARALGSDLAEMADLAESGRLPSGEDLEPADRALYLPTRWESWRHGQHWLALMRNWATAGAHLMVISPNDREEAGRLLGAASERVHWVPNGVDLSRFERAEVGAEKCLERWRRWLVSEPLGWREGAEPGSVGYGEADLEAFVDPDTGAAAPVLLFVGRFTEVKRIPLLVRAYARARERVERPAPLVLLG